jgi:choline-sulfatase
MEKEPRMARNLLFITTDQQRWDSLPCYGLDFMQTPALDRIAREGLVFERCIVSSPVCVPCRAAFMSGQYPSTTGVLGNGAWLPESVPTWPERVGATGRRTVAIGKMHFDPWDARCGFDQRISAEDKRHVYLPDDHVTFLREHGLDRPHPASLPGYFESIGAPVTPREKRFHVDGFTGDQAAAWLRRYGDEPFAAWVSFAGPHDPYDPPQEMASMYYDAPIPEPIGSADELAHKPPAQRDRGKGSLGNSMFRIDPSQATAEHFRLWRAHYYANISLIDEGIGKMLTALEDAGTLDDTLIIFTSDHGDALGDHGMPFKGFFYDSMVHVPLLVRGPGVPAGRRSSALVSTLDLVPLFYSACDAEAPAGLQGENLSALLSDPDSSIRDAAISEIGGRIGVITDDYMYGHYADGSAELYDLRADPHEIDNLADDPGHTGVVSRMRGILVDHAVGSHPQLNAPVSVPQYPVRVRLETEYRRHREAGVRPEDVPFTKF